MERVVVSSAHHFLPKIRMDYQVDLFQTDDISVTSLILLQTLIASTSLYS